MLARVIRNASAIMLSLGVLAAASPAAFSQQLAPASLVKVGSGSSIVSEPTTGGGEARAFRSKAQDEFSLHVVPTAIPPLIDGSLDDLCWRSAPVISAFTQVEPTEGAAPTERTEVRVLYDRDFLYFAIRCADARPDAIRGTQMQHDADLQSDDSVALILDTFGSRRSGYFFQTNPAGAKQEGLVEADGSINTNWDTIWSCRSRRDKDGWTTEIAIPFRSLSFDPASSAWGFNVERIIRHKQEIVRWAFPSRNKSISSLADVGALRDLSGIQSGIGLEVRPFLAARYRDQREGRDRQEFELKPGLDAFFRITPLVTAGLTLNTDFAETEVDARQVNLTRFPLYFPEKRGFFLEDANLFAFNASNGPRAFYSRRIGLSPNGEAVDILAGGKLAGRTGNLEFGLLDVELDESRTTPAANLAAARLSYRVLEESSVGAIFTHGSPSGTNDNWLAGGDLNYRNSHLFGNNVLTAQTWLLKSDGRGIDTRQMAFGGSLAYPNEPLWIAAEASQIDPDFNPGLGFVSRRGIRDYTAYARYRWRPGGYFRSVDFDFAPHLITNLRDEIETESWSAPSITLLNQRGDQLYAGFVSNRENLSEKFEIQPGVVIPRDDYRFNRAFLAVSTTSARPISAYGSVDAGEFYHGSSQKYGGGIECRASPRIFLSVQSELDHVDLPVGGFDVVVSSARLNLTLSPEVSWNTLVQHDNVSGELGLYSRLKWTVRPGSDIYLVFKNGFDAEDGRFRAKGTEISTKVSYTCRF